jgi:hypothetical protein
MIALITPDRLDFKVPIIIGEEKLPEALLSWAVKILLLRNSSSESDIV